MNDEQATAILEQRARMLARPSVLAEEGPGESLVTFSRGARYALPVAAIREVRPYVAPQPLPGAPAFMVGLIAARGGVVPAIDLGTFLGAPATGDPGSFIIVVDGSLEVALLADAVAPAGRMPRTSIARLPAGTPSRTREYGIGLVRGAGVLLDATRLLRGIASSVHSPDAAHGRPGRPRPQELEAP